MAMNIIVDDLRSPQVAALLTAHLQNLAQLSPPESVHALDLHGLRQPDLAFFTAWQGTELLGCGALKALDAGEGEIKSMRTATPHLRQGVARALLLHIIAQARQRAYQRLSLETGAQAAFMPARQLYASCGFAYCGPFADYVLDPNNVFMTLALR